MSKSTRRPQARKQSAEQSRHEAQIEQGRRAFEALLAEFEAAREEA